MLPVWWLVAVQRADARAGPHQRLRYVGRLRRHLDAHGRSRRCHEAASFSLRVALHNFISLSVSAANCTALWFCTMEDGSLMYITSKAFKPGSRIPPQYTQVGQGARSNMSPPLEWHNVPEAAKCLALIVEDPEPQMENSPISFTHWIVLNIPPTLKGLPENFATKEHDDDHDELTQIREGMNDFKIPNYRGPNPPVGDHNYEFHLYALDDFPKVSKKPNKARLLEAMEGHILQEAVLVGHYNKVHSGTG